MGTLFGRRTRELIQIELSRYVKILDAAKYHIFRRDEVELNLQRIRIACGLIRQFWSIVIFKCEGWGSGTLRNLI